MGYWRKVWGNAVRRYRLRLSQGSERIMGFLVQTAILFGVLYFQPWVGSLQDEAKLAGAGVLSVLGSAALSFLWDLVVSTKELHEKLEGELAQSVEAIGWYADQAEAQDQLIALYREGEAIYCGESSYAAWRDGMFQWNERVLAALRIAYEPQVAFRYQKAKGQLTRAKWIEIADEDQPRRGEYNTLFSNWLQELEAIVTHRAPNGTDWQKIRELNAHRVAPDSLKALNEKNRRELPSADLVPHVRLGVVDPDSSKLTN